MVKHSPIDRLRQIQQQRNVQAEVHGDPNTILPAAEELPPVGEALRRAAEVRAEADALDRQAADFEEPVDHGEGVLPLPLHPNVNTRRRGRPDPSLQDPEDDLGSSFMGEDMPATPPPWLSQVIMPQLRQPQRRLQRCRRGQLRHHVLPLPQRSSATARFRIFGSQSLRNGSGFLMPTSLSSSLRKMPVSTRSFRC